MSISKPDISSKNLNLFAIFLALFEAENVTEAAKKLKMSQPNLSRALRILREEFEDPLFVRASRGIVPTDRAKTLAPTVREALKAAEKVYNAPEFDLKKAVGKFTIATTDYIEMFIGPKLACTINREAPGLTLSLRPSQGFLTKQELEKGEHDLSVLVVREKIPPNFFKQDLFDDPYVCAVRKNHPILNGKFTIDKFIEYGHALINPQGSYWGITDDYLAKLGKPRRLVVASPNAISCAFTIAQSDLILTATEKFLRATQQFLPIEIFESPFKIEPIHIAQVWHERSQQDPIHRWVREKVREILLSARTTSM